MAIVFNSYTIFLTKISEIKNSLVMSMEDKINAYISLLGEITTVLQSLTKQEDLIGECKYIAKLCSGGIANFTVESVENMLLKNLQSIKGTFDGLTDNETFAVDRQQHAHLIIILLEDIYALRLKSITL